MKRNARPAAEVVFPRAAQSAGDAGRTENLERFRWSVDYVLTHDCSEKMKIFLSMGQQSNSLNQFLTEIERKLQFHKWFSDFTIWTSKFRPGTVPYTSLCGRWIRDRTIFYFLHK